MNRRMVRDLELAVKALREWQSIPSDRRLGFHEVKIEQKMADRCVSFIAAHHRKLSRILESEGY